jgi:hypothetical protein
LVATVVTLYHVTLLVELWRVMVAFAMPVVPALSVPLMVKFWLTATLVAFAVILSVVLRIAEHDVPRA